MESYIIDKKDMFNKKVESILVTTQDILNLYGINLFNIIGYKMLTDNNKKLYKEFIVNFFNKFDIETRKNVKPISFNEIEEVEYLGENDEDDSSVIVFSKELYIIKSNGLRKLFKSSFNKSKNVGISLVLKNRYMRFEYEISGVKEHVNVLNENEWYWLKEILPAEIGRISFVVSVKNI